MSWLFGIKSNPPQQGTPDLLDPTAIAAGTAGGGGGDGRDSKGQGAAAGGGSGSGGVESKYRFDSAALERAAAAAKELEKSPHAREVRLRCTIFIMPMHIELT